MSKKTLCVALSSKDSIRGSFEQDGVGIDFAFDRNGTASHMRIEAAKDRLVLVETTVENNLETTTLLGTHTFTGRPGHTAIDADVLAELAALPEMQLMPELKHALNAAGVDEALVAGPTELAAHTQEPTRNTP